VNPVEILQKSYERCIEESRESGLLGSSTALLAILLDSELRIAHLGDCSIGLIRGNEMIFRSDEMQHSFNYPVQLGPRSQSTPRANAKRFDLQVEENDIIVLASDGMGDNLWDEDVLDEVMRFTKTSNAPGDGSGLESPTARKLQAQGLSEALASRAKRASESTNDDPSEEVPFGRQAKTQGLRYVGGKPDDISVLVAVISGCSPKQATQATR
jgi:protein phosphatase PTC7